MVEVFTQLVEAIDSEFAGRPKIATLASVDAEGAPRARTIVCRRIEPRHDGVVFVIVSDRRSGKNRDFRRDPRAELVFWLSASRTQYRITGNVDIRSAEGQDEWAQDIWRSLSDASRSLFFWPAPGLPRMDTETHRFLEDVAEETAAPDTFEVLTLYPVRIERLNLNEHPHARRRWERKSGWVPMDMNP